MFYKIHIFKVSFFKHQILGNFWIKSCFLPQCVFRKLFLRVFLQLMDQLLELAFFPPKLRWWLPMQRWDFPWPTTRWLANKNHWAFGPQKHKSALLSQSCKLWRCQQSLKKFDLFKRSDCWCFLSQVNWKQFELFSLERVVNITDTVIKRQNNFKFLNYKIALLFYIWQMDGLAHCSKNRRKHLISFFSKEKIQHFLICQSILKIPCDLSKTSLNFHA